MRFHSLAGRGIWKCHQHQPAADHRSTRLGKSGRSLASDPGETGVKLSEIKQILSERNLMLTKSLGQNFLHDQNQLQRIVSAAELNPGDKVLEIGPGLGPLTELLAAGAGEVLAIEKDQRLYDMLREKFRNEPRVKLLHDDALRYVEQNRDW